MTVIIVGGGVIGLSTAYQLARRKAGRIILLDKGIIGCGSSSRAAGIGTHLIWTETGVLARKIGFQLFREFSDEWDDFTFHDEEGCLNVIAPDAWPARAELLPMYDRLGVPYEVLSAQDIRRRWPDLTPADDYLAIHDPLGGYSEPARYVPALEKRVRELGVEVLEGEQVVGFLQQGQCVSGVRTTSRSIESDAVVSAVHAWSLPLWQELAIRLPIKNFVHQRYLSRPLSHPYKAPPVNADPYCGYVRPADGNRILMGVETPEREEVRPGPNFNMSELSTSPLVKESGRELLSQLAPILKQVEWESEYVGLISFSCDGEPVLGAVSQRPGLFVAASFHSGGYSYNAVAGLLTAELVCDGKTSIDIQAFSPNRFTSDETDCHLSETISQKSAVRRRH